MGVLKEMGDFLGLKIAVIEGPTCTPDEIRQVLTRYNTVHLLRTLGQLSDPVFFGKNASILTTDAIIYIARAAIEVASDERHEKAEVEDINRVAEMYHNLEESLLGDEDEALRILIRMGFGQLVHHPDVINSIGRAWYMYLDLWPRVAKAAALSVEDQMRKITGAPFHKTLALGLAYWASSRKGYTVPYSADALENIGEVHQCTYEEASRIYKWLSCSYSEVQATSIDVASKYQLSPLAITPLVKPKIIPAGGSEDLRVVPFPSFILHRITSGMFHALAETYNRGGKSNDFRTAFGHVFEAYVGEILKAGCGEAAVLPEFRYGNSMDSPDWMVFEGDTLLVVEVKSSTLSLTSKTLGDLVTAKKDLEKNVKKGVEQLLRFKTDVLNDKTGRDELFSDVRKVELLLVTQEGVPCANFLYPRIFPNADKVHFASIEELELLQSYSWNLSPFRFLATKGQDSRSRAMDLDKFLREFWGSPLHKRHPFLSRVSAEFLREVGVAVTDD